MYRSDGKCEWLEGLYYGQRLDRAGQRSKGVRKRETAIRTGGALGYLSWSELLLSWFALVRLS